MSTQKGERLPPHFAMVKRYFEALDRFDVDSVVDCFSENVVFGHPQIKDWKPGVSVLHGRQAIRDFMIEYRKKQDSHHRLTGFGEGVPFTGEKFVDGGPFYFVTVTGRNSDYLASVCIVFEVDEDGRISRYSPHVAPAAYNLQTSESYIWQYTTAYL